MLKYFNQIIVFMMELVMVGFFAYYGYHRNTTVLNRYLLACCLPGAAIFLWGRFAAPKSSTRLTMPYLVMFRAMMFLVTSVVLYQSGNVPMAIIIAVLAVVTQAVSYSTGE